MRVLVTGASGVIGSAVCERLLTRGDEVAGLSRDPARAGRAKPGVSWHGWDPTAERPPVDALEGVDAVINLVGEAIDQRLTDEAKERIHASRVRATRNLVGAMTTASPRPRALESQSAVGYYGDRGEAMVDEATPPGDDFLSRLCVEWEAAASEAADSGIRTVIVRSGPILDPDSGLLKQLLLPFKLGVNGPLAGGGQYMPWVHLEDEVSLLVWAAGEQSASGVINGMAPNPLTNREFSKTLGRVLGRPAVVPVPKAAVKLLLGSELGEAVTGSQRAIPRRALDLGFSFAHPELEPALRDLLDR